MLSTAERESDFSFHPGRLWSLWDMMKFNAVPFYEITQLLRNFRTNVDAQKDSNPEFYKRSLRNESLGGGSAIVSFIDGANKLKPLLNVLGAKVTSLIVDDLLSALETNRYIALENVSKFYEEIDTSLKRELSLVTLLSLNATEQRYFEGNESIFGPDFDAKFQTSGAFELDEAAKCLALGRPTASVFHLMRLMEIGVASVARCLNIPDPVKPSERNWGKILDSIDAGIKRKWPTTSDRTAGEGSLFEGLYASLDAVKNPWRNATMHVENKYTEDEAEHIFIAVKGFMKKLASRMDENGEPKA